MSLTATAQSQVRRIPFLPWRRLGQFDWALLAAVVIAVAAGLAMIHSATLRMGNTGQVWDDLVVKQLVFAAVGFVVLACVTLTEYRLGIALWAWLYGGVLVLLVLNLMFGKSSGGAERWLSLGFIDLQPSEFTKVILILSLAAYFERFDVRKFRHVFGSLALAAVPMALVIMQPNLSTTILLLAIWLGMAVAAGIRPMHFSLLALLGAPAVVAMFKLDLIKSYQLIRVLAWLDPQFDPGHFGFQNIQTLIAVGNGQLWGTGFAHGSQTQGNWLPLPYADNIFALVAEELGFVGGLAVLMLLGFIIWRVFRAASLAQDRAGGLVVAGIGTYLLVQTFVNVGVVLQLLPVTGLSLPFISYGGSSLVALFVAIGVVQSVLVRRKPLEFH